MWKEDTVWDALSIQPASMLIKALTMNPPMQGEGSFVPTISAEKISILQNDKNEHFYIRTTPARYKSYDVDLFEIRTRNEANYPAMVLYCDENGYSKLYRSESFDPMSGERLLLVERDKFDNHGFPKIWITEESSPSTSQVRKAERVFETMLINVSFPGDIFEFNPPGDFSSVDYRPDSPLVLEPSVETFGMENYPLPAQQKFAILKFFLMGIGFLIILLCIGIKIYPLVRPL